MSQSESAPKPIKFTVTISDASHLPIYHVNVLNLRFSIDEFYFTLGAIPPLDRAEIEELSEKGQAVAQPVFRFAVSRDTMEQFLTLMASQFDQQTTVIQQLHRPSEEASKEEASRNE